MNSGVIGKPDWESLYRIAASQEGQFTTDQAVAVGYSSPLLTHHLKAGKIVRIRHGIYRLVHFPPGDQEELVTAWLWTDSVGVFSHQTALLLHGLSDILPAQIHVTLPSDWRKRRFRLPQGMSLHYADLRDSDRVWCGAVPITSPGRTLCDCAIVGLSPDLLRQATRQAIGRGLVQNKELTQVRKSLEPFGGIE